MSNRITHFEIQVDDLERAAKFYTDVFWWNIEKWHGWEVEYWMIMTAEKDSTELGINGWMLKRLCPVPKWPAWTNAYVCTVVVENFDITANKIMKAGGQVAMEKFPIIWIAWQWYFIDTEGNTFWVHQPDVNAK